MPVVESVPLTLALAPRESWWAVGIALALIIAAGTLGERMLLRRLVGDQRPVNVQQHSRRSARWLVALATVALAQAAVVVVGAVGVDWAGGPGAPGLVTVAVLTVVAVVSLVFVVRRPSRRRTAVPTTAGQLAPALLTAAGQEVLFRGALLTWSIAVGLPPVAAVAVTAAVYGATRLTRGRAAAVAAALVGAVLGGVAVLTGWVAVAVAGHAVLLLVVAALGARGTRVAAAATAGAGVGCGGHDPNSPACAGCPLAAAAPRRDAAVP